MNRTTRISAAAVILIFVIAANASAQTKPDHPNHYEPSIPDVEAADTLRALFIGNSFTYVYDTYSLLQEIAASQAHRIDFKAAFVGGYSFARHLADPKTYAAIEKLPKPYDIVFLQNQSQLNALYGREPRRFALAAEDARELVARVKEYSPAARIFLEATWASDRNSRVFDSKEDFDKYMWKGTCAMAKRCRCSVSPIGHAFAIARAKYPDIDLLGRDHHHQSLAGAYLKACVNYLLIYGGDFDESASCCTLPADVAVKMQKAAAEAVRCSGKN